MSYAVKEIFLTLQGEGAHTGRATVFCRFAGCNLWSGREADRATAQCRFCDTDFVGTDGTRGGRYEAAGDLADAIAQEWGETRDFRAVVLTGGEPLLQVDGALLDALHARGFWIRSGDELKLVYPQEGAPPDDFSDLDFWRFSLQPMDGPEVGANTARAVAYCLAHPQWQLSLQSHKTLGIR
jgi:organic radical activating enzyme